jgi:hypothetical protein
MQLTVLGIVGVLAGLVAAEMLKEIVRREYGSWAPGLACVLVRLAGLIHSSRAAEWRADVLYLQSEGKSGLWEAACHLLAAPKLSVRELAGKHRALVGAEGTDSVPVDWAGVSWVGVGEGILGDGFSEWVQSRLQEGNGRSRGHVSSVFETANWFAGDPQDVGFAWSEDGEFRGMGVSGAEELAIVTTPSYYERHLKTPPWCHDVFLATPEAFDALAKLADAVDRDRVGGHKNASVYIAFYDRWQIKSSCECCEGD